MPHFRPGIIPHCRQRPHIALLVVALVAAIPCLRAQPVAGPAAEQPTTMPAVQVTAGRVAASEVEGPDGTEVHDARDIESTGAFSVEEFIATLPPPEQGTRQLVLVDGRETYLDPNTLPVGMIESIEVNRDGAMPQYGAFTDGRIINIRLKKDYAGSEIGTKLTGAFDGGGFQRKVRLAGGIKRERLRILYSVEASDSQPLLAADRPFSRDQDHTDDGGRDLRLSWGYPAVVGALDGPLPGLALPGGSPVFSALVPAGQDGTGLTPGAFELPDPAIGDTAADQRRFNTASYRWLVSPSQRVSVNLGFEYKVNERLRVSLEGSEVDSRGRRMGPPPVTPASGDTIVPAAYSPFGQDVSVGLVHLGFGPTFREDRSRRQEIGMKFDGRMGADWRWQADVGRRRDHSRGTGNDLDPSKFSVALAAADPSLRFNPFADERAAPVNAALYRSLASPRISDDRNSRDEIELSAKGSTFQLPGGAAQLRTEVSWENTSRDRLSTRRLGQPLEETRLDYSNREYSANANLPLAGPSNTRAGLRRLEAQIDGGIQEGSRGERENRVGVSLLWSPARPLLLRARLRSQTESVPSEVQVINDILVGDALVDPLRGGEAVTGVRIFTRPTSLTVPEQRTFYSLAATLEPPSMTGLKLRLQLNNRHEEAIVEDEFDPQEIVSNSGVFADRIGRADPTPEDLATGRPGTIESVDISPGNTGSAKRSQLEYEISYRPPEGPSGRWRMSLEAEQMLRAEHDLAPGIPYAAEGGRYHRPDWRVDASLSWFHAGWGASVRGRHESAVDATPGAFNGEGASTTVSIHATRRWELGSDSRRRRDLKLAVGIGNVFAEAPPFADTLNGYRNGSPLGRTYNCALSVEM